MTTYNISGNIKINGIEYNLDEKMNITEHRDIELGGMILRLFTKDKTIKYCCEDCFLVLSTNSHYCRHKRTCQIKNKKKLLKEKPIEPKMNLEEIEPIEPKMNLEEIEPIEPKMNLEEKVEPINKKVKIRVKKRIEEIKPIEPKMNLEEKIEPVEIKKRITKIIKIKKNKNNINIKIEPKMNLEQKEEKTENLKITGIEEYWDSLDKINITDTYFMKNEDLAIYNGFILNSSGVQLGTYEDWRDDKDEIPHEFKMGDIVFYNGQPLQKFKFNNDLLYEECGIDYDREFISVYRYSKKKEDMILTNLIK